VEGQTRAQASTGRRARARVCVCKCKCERVFIRKKCGCQSECFSLLYTFTNFTPLTHTHTQANSRPGVVDCNVKTIEDLKNRYVYCVCVFVMPFTTIVFPFLHIYNTHTHTPPTSFSLSHTRRFYGIQRQLTKLRNGNDADISAFPVMKVCVCVLRVYVCVCDRESS
jgi:hypothetical protein